MTRQGFICAGCWTIDRIKFVSGWPQQEELAMISSVDRQGGGSAHNVAIDLKRLDPTLPVSTIGILGDDPDGNYLYSRAKRYGINTRQLLKQTAVATSYTDVITVTDSGKRTFFHYTGANDLLEPTHFDFSNHTARFLHLGLVGVHKLMDRQNTQEGNGWSQVLQMAQAHGLETSIEMVSIDPARNRQLVMPCLEYLDLLVVNDHEIGSIADIKTIDNSGNTLIDACFIAAKKALTLGKMRCVVVHYPEGALCVTKDGEEYMSQSLLLPESEIISTVGAGDAFVAGFMYALHKYDPIHQALKTGHAVAAASLSSATTTDGVVAIDQCLELAEQRVI